MQKLKHYCLLGIVNPGDHIPGISGLGPESKLITVVKKPDVGRWRQEKNAINKLIYTFNSLWAKY